MNILTKIFGAKRNADSDTVTPTHSVIGENVMDITVGKNSKPFFKVDSQLAAILVELGLATQLTEQKPAPALPKVPTFGIGTTPAGRVCIRLTNPDGSTAVFDGDPAVVSNAFKGPVWNAAEQRRTMQGPEIPVAVKEAYCRAYERQHVAFKGVE